MATTAKKTTAAATTETSKKLTKKSAVGAFEAMIKRNGDAIIGDRGDRIIKSAKSAQFALCNKLDQELMGLEDKRDLMLDQSPDNRYSLTVRKSFAAEAWALEYQSLSVEIANKQVELAIAQTNYEKLFGEKLG